MVKNLISVFICVICGQLMLVFSSLAAEYRVSPDDDYRDALKKLKAGDVLLLSKGVYKEQWTVSGINGTKKQPIIFSGEKGAIFRSETGRDGMVFWGSGGGERVQPADEHRSTQINKESIQTRYHSMNVIVENLRFEKAKRGGLVISSASNIVVRSCVFADNGVWGIQTCLSSHITVENCDMYGSKKENGVYFSTTDHPIVKNCKIHDNAGCGIHMNGDLSEGGDGVITGAIIENNEIYGNGRSGGAGINMDGVEYSMIYTNSLHDNLSGGIVSYGINAVRSGAGNNIIGNKIIFEEGKGRFGIALVDGATKAVVTDNVVVSGKGPALEVSKTSTSGHVFKSNKWFVIKNLKPISWAGKRMTVGEWKKSLTTRATQR